MRTWTWVSYVAAVALSAMATTTYNMAMAPGGYAAACLRRPRSDKLWHRLRVGVGSSRG
jgi:hypothetical protein